MQDLLGLGNEARMNTPSTYGNNWKWRLLKDEFGEKELKTLYEITKRYGRIGKGEKRKGAAAMVCYPSRGQ